MSRAFQSLRFAAANVIPVLLFSGLATSAHAVDVQTFTDRAAFLAATGATSASGSLPATSCCVVSSTIGTVTFSSGAGFAIDDYSPRLPGNELTINGLEHLGIALDAPAYALGFEFVEPEFDPLVNAAFVESTFTIAIAGVGSFAFSPPNDAGAFFGVWSSVAFSGVSITESVGGAENEFFGAVFTGTTAFAAPVPEPGNLGLLALGLPALLAMRSRRGRPAAR